MNVALRSVLVVSLFAAVLALAPGAASAQVPTEEGVELARVPAADESIYVTQLRSYAKRNHLEITPMFALGLNNRFVNHMGVMLGLSYHVRENFGIELMGGYSGAPLTRFSEATIEIREKENLEAPDAQRSWMGWFAGAAVQWSPFYGKLRLIPGILGDFDFYLLGGFGVVGSMAPCKARSAYNGNGVDPDQSDVQGISGTCPADDTVAVLPAGLRFAGQFGAGFRIFFAKWFGVRLELRDIIYSEIVYRRDAVAGSLGEAAPTTDIRNNVLFFLGLSFLI